MTIRSVRLGDVCEQDRTSVRPGDRHDLRYIGLETIEANTGQFQEGELSKTPDTPQANSFLFGPEHVLYGKLRPYLNKVALPDLEGKCSTEIIPLKPSPTLDRRYLFYFLRSSETVKRISERTAGARMPRADMDFVLGMQIPLPTMDGQRQVIDLLSRAESIVRLRREAQRKAQAIIPALFLDMFGDPSTNPKNWDTRSIGDVLQAADYGSSTKASEAGDGLPLIRMSNVTYSGDLDLTDLKHVSLPETEVERYGLRPGDILFNRTNSKELVGKTGLWEGTFEAIAASYFIRLRVNEAIVRPIYLWAFLNTKYMKRVLFDTARGAIGQANINSRELRSFRVPVPAAPLQERFESRCRELRALQAQQDLSALKAEATFKALLARSFSQQTQDMLGRLDEVAA